MRTHFSHKRDCPHCSTHYEICQVYFLILCYTIDMANDKIVRDYAMKDDNKSEIFHSSGIAAAGSGEQIGAGTEGAADLATRQALEAQRQFAGKYRETTLGQSLNPTRRAKVYSGELKRNFGRKEGSGPEHQGYGRVNGPVKHGYGRSEGTGERGGYGRVAGGSVGAGGSGGLASTPPARKNAGISLH